MNKSSIKLLLCIVLAMALFGGCTKTEQPVETPKTSAPVISEEPVKENDEQPKTDAEQPVETPETETQQPVETPETSAPVISEGPVEENDGHSDAEAKQAYKAFLNGAINVTTSEIFRQDDDKNNFDRLLYGTYSYEELKAAIAGDEVDGSTTKYALVDFGQDGVNELAIRFENVAPDILNWVGIIKYNGEGLDLNYYYEDGYRTSSALYSSGYLQVYGSMGAGADVSTLVGFDKNGAGTDVFTVKNLYGTFVESAAYDLREDGKGLTGNYDDIAGVSAIEVIEFMSDGAVMLSVSGWSEDTAVREREEALIGELEDLGAEIIMERGMQALCSMAPYEAPEVDWNVWNDGGDVDGDAGEIIDVEALISISFPDEELLAQPQNFSQFIADDSEYQVKVLLSTDFAVTNFCVLSLSIDNVDEDGTMTFSEAEMYSLEVLTPEKPLVVGMAFPGTIPNMGISYVDANGMERVYAITLSGNDGRPLLVEAELTR